MWGKLMILYQQKNFPFTIVFLGIKVVHSNIYNYQLVIYILVPLASSSGTN